MKIIPTLLLHSQRDRYAITHLSLFNLYRLSNHIAHGIRRLPHHIRRGVSIGAECEPCRVMPQGAGQSLHIHAILQRERGEGMPEIMEPNMLRSDGFQDLLMGVSERVRIEHSARLGRREHVRIPRMLLVLLHQQVHCLLRDRQDADGIVGFGLAYYQFSLSARHLLRDGDGSVLYVQVRPE